MQRFLPTWRVKVIFLLLSVCLIQTWGNNAYGQIGREQRTDQDSTARVRSARLEAERVERQHVLDSTRAARTHVADSIKAERQRITDSVKTARAHITDSIARARKQKADSLTAIRKYRDSKRYRDSVAQERQKEIDTRKAIQQAYFDSVTAERKRITDSTTTARKIYTDSIKAMQTARADSIAAIRKYKESRRYRDSIEAIRQHRTDSIRTVRQQYNDSVVAARKHRIDSITTVRTHIRDSTAAARKAYTDSITTVRKARADSLAAIRKYKESKRYRDSVAIVRQGRMDSLRAVRKHFNDSMIAARKQKTDSITAVRTHIRDSITAVRKAYTDSITTVRKARADSLAKVKEQRERDREVMAKNREKRMQLALDLKIKKKREAWSNEKMLKRKWSIPRRAIQNTFTRYNYYFNANNKMEEALRNMQRTRKENYDSLLALFPFDPNRDSTMLASDMDSIIQKTSIGIQIHDPRTKWSDDLYLLMGQAYYYKGDYKNASITFRYIVSIRRMLEQEKKKRKKNPYRRTTGDRQPSIAAEEKKNVFSLIQHRTAHNDGLLWLIRTYTQSEQPEQAESVIELLAADPKFPKHLEGRLALEKSFLYLKEGNTQGAAQQLAVVADDKDTDKWLRMRAAYINGQLQQEEKNYLGAADHFRDVIALHPNIEMDFYSRKHLAYNLMYAGGEQDEAIASLKSMLKDGKYLPYYEQIYFVLGRLAANSNNTQDAITYLQKSISAPRSTDRQKAVSFATLGDIQYKIGNYTEAKLAYDSAAYLAGSAPGEPVVDMAVRRSQSLDQITSPLEIIRSRDSLLQLATLSEREQLQIVRRHIRRLEQERQDSIFRAENAMPGLAGGGAQGGGNYGNWYFANASLMQQGMNEFKRKWGNRKLADNWRRSAASGFAAGADPEGFGDATSLENEQVGLDENGLPTEESLLAAIPTTPESQAAAKELIQRAYTDLGQAYIGQLEDYPRALAAMDTLDSRYPQHPHQAEILYLRYLAALKQNRLPDAQTYSTRLINEFPESPFAQLVRPADDLETDTDVPVDIFYDNTYSMLRQRQFQEVIQRAARGRQLYNDPQYNPKFTIAEASALAGMNNFDQADTVITTFIQQQPPDSLLSWAQTIKDYITRSRPTPDSLGADSLTTPGADAPQVDSLANNNNLGKDANDIPDAYTYNPREPHYFLFVFSEMDTKVMGIRAALTDLNNLQFADQELSLELEVLDGQQGMIVAQTFNNATQARNYLRVIKSNAQIFRDFNENEYHLMVISAKNYRKLLFGKDISEYGAFFKSRYR